VELPQTLFDTSRKIKHWIGKRRFVRWVFAKVWAHRLIGWQGKSDTVVRVRGWKSALIDKDGGSRQGVSFVVNIGPFTFD
jgi:hypothetical protein